MREGAPTIAPTIAITAGEPAGIGPELIALLGERHRERPFAARLVVLGDHPLLTARAERIGLAPRYTDYVAARPRRPPASSKSGISPWWRR